MKNGGINIRFKKNYRICKKTGCWNWIGYKQTSGYGSIMFNYVYYRAHRLSYLLYKGSIKKGLLVCHKCDNPKCVNPDHLFLGTSLENRQDCMKKGRASWSGFKLTHDQVMKIRNSDKKVTHIAKELKVGRNTIYNVINNKTYRNL